MFRFTAAAVLSAAALTNAIPNIKRQDTASVKWGECEFPHSNQFQLPLECGTLTVPLDYSDEASEETLELNLVKIPASNTKNPVLGSMLYNPGGPGQSGITYLIKSGHQLQIVSGGRYDLIGFDTRGTGRTLPLNCTGSAEALPVEKRDEHPLFTEDLMDLANRKWPSYTEFVGTCTEALSEKGSLVGTAFAARDMLQIVDALEEDGLLRYYGVSYGTLLGWTFAQMFPDRVDRMILDGNVNPYQYWAGEDLEAVQDVDALLVTILDACFADPEVCPLKELESTDKVLEGLNTVLQAWEPIPHPLEPKMMFGVADLKLNLVKPLYNPLKYPLLAQMLLSLIKTGEFDFAAAGLLPPAEPVELPEQWHQSGAADALYSIRCGDWPRRASDPSELEDIISRMNGGSWPDTTVSDFAMCYSWPFFAKEQYSGEYSSTTKHPVLFVNPTWDPVTPLTSARNASSTLEGSVVLEHRGVGHSTFAQMSLCTMTNMRDYMVTGDMPAEDTVCEPDMPIYANLTQLDSAVMQNKLLIDLIIDAGAVDVEKFIAEHQGEMGGGSESASGGAGGAEGSASSSSNKESSAAIAAPSLSGSLTGLAGLLAAFVVAI